MNAPQNIAAVFHANTITVPFATPVILTGKKEDKNYAFTFNFDGDYYYIFATLQQGVINNNLPVSLDAGFKSILIESVNQYCESSRNGLQDNLFTTYQRRT